MKKKFFSKSVASILVMLMTVAIIAVPTLAKTYGNEEVATKNLAVGDEIISKYTDLKNESADNTDHIYLCPNKEKADEKYNMNDFAIAPGKSVYLMEAYSPESSGEPITGAYTWIVGQIGIGSGYGTSGLAIYVYPSDHTHTWGDPYSYTDNTIDVSCKVCFHSLDSAQITADDANYDGQPHGAAINGESNWNLAGFDFSIHYTGIDETDYDSDDAPVDAGTYRATMACGSATAYTDFTINPRALVVKGLKDTYDYTGKGVVGSGDYTVYGVNNTVLKEGEDYIVSIDGGKADNSGEGKHLIEFISKNDNYTSVEFEYTIVKTDVPKTGDSNNAILYVFGAIAALGLGFVAVAKRREGMD